MNCDLAASFLHTNLILIICIKRSTRPNPLWLILGAATTSVLFFAYDFAFPVKHLVCSLQRLLPNSF